MSGDFDLLGADLSLDQPAAVAVAVVVVVAQDYSVGDSGHSADLHVCHQG